MIEGPVVQSILATMFAGGLVGIMWVLHDVAEQVRKRWGRVPVLDAGWWLIRDAIEWALHLPGRMIRWLRPRDTPRGLGGP